MARSAFEQLPDASGGSDAAPETDYFSNSFFQEAGPNGAPALGQKASINRIRADDLAARGVPYYRNAGGDVQEVSDAAGGPLSGFNAKTGIAYDSQGAPKQVQYEDNTSPPKVTDPFANIPARTDPNTGAIEKNGPGGIYQYLGQDAEVTAKVKQQGQDKDLAAESTLLGRKLTLDEHDLVQANKTQKDLHGQLTEAVPGLLDPKYEHASQDQVNKAIDTHFDTEYAAPEANATAGFFSKDLSPDAQALRADIDKRKAAARDMAGQLFDVGDQMNQLQANIEGGRDKQRANVETLLAHQQGQTGPLDQPAAGQPVQAAGSAQLYPPEENWSRILGGPDAVAAMHDNIKANVIPAQAAPAVLAATHDMQDARDKADALKFTDPTLADKYFALAAKFTQGLTSGIGDLLKSPEAAGKLPTFGMPSWSNPLNWASDLADAATKKIFGVTSGDMNQWAGKKITDAGNKLVDMTDARLKNTLAGDIAGIAGSVAPWVGMALATKGSSVAAPLMSGMFFASTHQQVKEDALAHGATPEKADLVGSLAGIPAAIVAMPVGGGLAKAAASVFGESGAAAIKSAVSDVFEKSGMNGVIDMLTKFKSAAADEAAAAGAQQATAVPAIQKLINTLKLPAAMRVAAVGKQVAAGVALGAGYQTSENLLKKTYNPDQQTFEGVPEVAATFGALQGASAGFKTLVEARQAKQSLDVATELRNLAKSDPKEFKRRFAEEMKKRGAGSAGEPPEEAGPAAPEPPPAPKGPAGGPTKGGENADTQGRVSTTSNGRATTGTSSGESARSQKSGAQPDNANAGAEPETAGSAATGATATAERSGPGRLLTSIGEAEKAFVEQGGHADRLEGQQKLAALRKQFPDKSDRLAAINERFAPAVSAEDLTPPPTKEGAATAGKPTGALTTETPAKDQAVVKTVDEATASTPEGAIPPKNTAIQPLPAPADSPSEVATPQSSVEKPAIRTSGQSEPVAKPDTSSSPVDVAAHKAATSPKNGLAPPTGPQEKAGNYQKGHALVGPSGEKLDISFENPAGSKRQPEFSPLKSHYGYVKGTVGADKDHVDVFVKPKTPLDYDGPVFVVNQYRKDGKFDEHKAVIGVNDVTRAREEYQSNYEKGWTGGKSVVRFENPAAFKKWAETGAKGRPAIDPRLPAAFGKVAAHLHLTYEGDTRSGQMRFSTPEGKVVVTGAPDAKLLVKAAKNVESGGREPEKSVRGDTVQPGQVSGGTGKAGAHEVGGGVLSQPSSERQSEEAHRRVRLETEEQVRAGVEKAKQLHAATAKKLGVAYEERELPIGRSGIATKLDGATIFHDYPKIVAHAVRAHDLGGDSQRFLNDAEHEELEHVKDIRASAGNFDQVHQDIWNSLTDGQQQAVQDFYPASRNDIVLAAEYVRMLAQHRELGRETESNYRDTKALDALLEGKQSDVIEEHLKKMAAETAGAAVGQTLIKPANSAPETAIKRPEAAIKAPETAIKRPETPQIAPLGGKYVLPSFVTEQYTGKNKAVAARAERRIDLAKRLEAVADQVPAAERTVITTLLKATDGKEPSDTALAQAEKKIDKYEGAQNATTAGKQPTSEGGELSRVPPRKDVRADTSEIRKEEGAKTDAGSGTVERGAPSAEQQPGPGQPGQLDAKADKALDDAFEGLFAGTSITPGSDWKWPEPLTDEDFENIVLPHSKGVEAGLRLGPEHEAAVQAEYDQAAKDMIEAARVESPRFKALFGKQTYLAGKLEGIRRSGPNYEEYMRRTEPLEAGTPATQQAIPIEKLPKLITAAQELIRQGIDTPEKLASVLEAKFAGKARPYTQALWDALGIIRPDLRGTHDWVKIYGALPQKKDDDKGAEVLRDQVARKLLSKQPLPRTALAELAKGVAGELSTKEIDEAAEAGIVDAARTIARSAAARISPVDTFDKLVDLYGRQPNLTAKTSTSKVNQAYSTPAPLAYAASRLADISGGSSIYEPSAGNGMLLIETDPNTQTVFANELNGTRVRTLADQGYKPTAQDATKYRPPLGVDRVVSNAPFGTVLDANGENKTWPMWDSATNQIDFAIAAKSLEALTDDGRAVLILGGKNITDPDERAQAYARQDFWPKLYEQYRVVDHFTVDGDLYSKQGAGWPVDVVIIAGRGKSPIQLPSAEAPRIIGSWDGLRDEITRTDQERVEAGRYDEGRDRKRLGDIFGDIRGIAGAEQRTGAERLPEPTGSKTVGGGNREGVAPVGGESSELAEQRRTAEPSDEADAERAGAVGARDLRVESEQRGPLGGYRVPYKPASKAKSFGIFIPTNMEAPAREALVRLQERVGPIDDFVRSEVRFKDGSLSAEQIDSAALAIDAIKSKTAAVNGDQGGVGKGRVAAAMMGWAVDHGLTPIFSTKDEKLYAAMLEDLHDIGREDIVPLMTNSDIAFKDFSGRKWVQGDMRHAMEEIARTGKLPGGANALFTSYYQIQKDVPKNYKPSKQERAGLKNSHTPPPDGARMMALKKLAPGSIIIADESHLASGDSITAWRLGPLLAQAHGVYYSSATFAKRPDSMGIYSRTSLSHATNSMSDLVDAMKQGGVPLQQVVSATLASDGLYMRRERDFSKAVFRTHINLDTRDRDIRLSDNYTSGLRSILDISNKMAAASKKLNRILRRQGNQMHVESPPRIETTNFSSKLHNLVRQYLYAVKSETLVRRAVEGATKGFTNAAGKTERHRIVIAVQNTMEQPILDLERSGRPLNFNGMLLNYLDSQRRLVSGHGPTAQTITITDTPDPEFESLSDAQLQDHLIAPNPENSSEAGVNEKAMAELFRRIMAGVFKETEAQLEALDLADMPLSPIDYIKQQLTRVGIKTAEITGRETGIDEDGAIYRIRKPTKAAHLQNLNDFNNGDVWALIMNSSGSTGISAHASEKFKNVEPRAMLIGQANLDINEFMQTLWRIDRTGQVHEPYYEIVQTALVAELRPAAILNRKMGGLNANTTSNAENEISAGNNGVDLFNQYGDQVVYNYLVSDPLFTDMLAMPKIMDGDSLAALNDILPQYENDGQLAAAVSGRVAVLPNEEAEAFWEKIQGDYVDLIKYLTQTGQNDLLSDTMDLKAETLESKELTPAVKHSGRPSGFDQPSQMEKVKADIGARPIPGNEVVAEMTKLGESAFEIISKWSEIAEEWKVAELARKAESVVNWTEEKAAHYEKRWRDQEEQIREALGFIGDGLHLKSDKIEGYGAITDLKLDAAHPLTPSKQMFTLHVNFALSGRKTLQISASQLIAIARMAAGDFEKLYESTAERGNIRYMVTGNLLSAYLAIRNASPTAKIIQYTTDKGDLRQGILMPVKFTPGALVKKRVVENASHMRALLDAGRGLTSSNGEVTLVKPRNEYVLRVPASKAGGGAYWRDEPLQKLMEGGEFVGRGNGMVGKIAADNLPKVYQRLLDLDTSLFYTEQGTHLHAGKPSAADAKKRFEQLRSDLEAATGEEYSDEAVQEHIDAAGGDDESLYAGKPHKAPAALYKDDVERIAKDIGLSVKESFDMLLHLVVPTYGVGTEAHDAAMAMLGERNQKAYQTDRVLEAALQSADKWPRPEQIAFVDRMKLGEAQPTPELQLLADTLRKIDTESWNAAVNAYKALGFKDNEVPLAWLENHFRVLWKQIPGSTAEEKAAWIGKARRGLRGSMGQHKQHTLDTMSEGLAEGGVPYSYNPIVMFKLAQADLWKLTTTLKAWKWAKDTGYVEFVRGAFPKAPGGMVALDDSIAKKYFPAESGEGLVAAGQYFVEEGFGRLLNNYLSTDHRRAARMGRGLIWIKNATTQLELMLSPFHAVFESLDAIGSNIGLGLSKLYNRGILGGNAKAAVEGLKDMVTAAATPVTHGLGKNSLGARFRRALVDPDKFFLTAEGKKMLADYPMAQRAAAAIFDAGFKPTELEQDWRNKSVRTFIDAISDLKAGTSDNYIGAGLRAFPAANEWLMRPLFDYYIPNLKVAQFLKEFGEGVIQNERKLKGGVLTEAALARQIWHFVENRFGEMNYDALFWNRTFKGAMQLMFRSVTWKLGSVNAFGGAFTGQGKEFIDAFNERRAPELHRNAAWLFGMMLLTATLGTILMKSLTGKWPSNYTDLVFPQIDPKNPRIRASLPTYWKDLVHLIHSPISYVTSSLSGWIGRVADLLRNKDYYGVEIHDNDDPATKQVLDVGKYFAQTLLPFSIRGYKNLSSQDVGTLRKTIALLGVQPAPRFIGQTAAERASSEYWKGQRSEAGIRPDQQEAKTEKRQLVAQIEHGEKPNIEAALASGAIKPRDIKAIYQRAQAGPLVSSVTHMPLADAERIYAKATPAERDRLAPILASKRVNTAKRQRTAFTGF